VANGRACGSAPGYGLAAGMDFNLQSREEAAIPVPATLRKPNPLVKETRRFYAGVRPDDDGRMRPGPRAGVAHLIVSTPALRGALLYLQAIFAEAERRGWEVTSLRGYEPSGVARNPMTRRGCGFRLGVRGRKSGRGVRTLWGTRRGSRGS
jgi:hypothetical protein